MNSEKPISDLYQAKNDLTQRIEELERQHAVIATELSQAKKQLKMLKNQLLWRYQERLAAEEIE